MKPGTAEDLTIEALTAGLGPGERLLGLDLGEKTVGLALSDVERRIATAFQTLPRRKFREDWAELSAIITQHRVAGLVLGLPLNMDGSSGPRAQASRAFARNLGVLGLPVLLWDERWSTTSAERAMIDQDMSRAKRAEKIDSHAAAVILQGAIDRLAGGVL